MASATEEKSEDGKSKDCHCAERPDPDTNGKVVARIPQGYDTRINLRFVPGRDFDFTPTRLGCRPRKGAPRRDADPVALPATLVDKLKEGNKRVVDWLALDAANAKLFVARPVEALAKAGVELSRGEMKMLDRAHSAVAEASVVAPGVKLTELNAGGYPTGRIDPNRPGSKPDSRSDDCGCEPRKKG